jgi:hypothetical protein
MASMVSVAPGARLVPLGDSPNVAFEILGIAYLARDSRACGHGRSGCSSQIQTWRDDRSWPLFGSGVGGTGSVPDDQYPGEQCERDDRKDNQDPFSDRGNPPHEVSPRLISHRALLMRPFPSAARLFAAVAGDQRRPD